MRVVTESVRRVVSEAWENLSFGRGFTHDQIEKLMRDHKRALERYTEYYGPDVTFDRKPRPALRVSFYTQGEIDNFKANLRTDPQLKPFRKVPMQFVLFL